MVEHLCPECDCSSYRWSPVACNEDGWEFTCGHDHKPGEPAGYCPGLDWRHLKDKVQDILLHLSGQLGGAPFLHVSSGTDGAILVEMVAKRCHEDGQRDQWTIIFRIFEALLSEREDGRSHGKYWQRVGDGVRSGDDIRDRCSCGALATSWKIGLLGAVGSCSDCHGWPAK